MTAKAADDLVAINEYGIETFGWAVAERYRDGLLRAFDLLADMPAIGREDPARPGLRRFFHGHHVIVYPVESAGVVVIRVPHVAMDPARHELGDGDRG